MKKLNQTEAVLRQEIIARKLATEEQLDGELSISFMQNCHSKVNLYLSLVRPEDVDAAYNKPARIEAGKEQAKKNEFRKFWNNTQEDVHARVQVAGEVGMQFQNLFPQFLSCEENTTQIVELLKQRGQLFNLENVISAYQTLAPHTLWITPENCGLEGSEAVRGKMLTSIKGWERVLEPVRVLSDSEKEQQRIAGLSADEYAAEFLQKDELPPLIQRRIESDIREFCANHPNYDPLPAGKEILLSWIREQGLHVCHDSLEASWAANKEKLHAANCVFDEGPSIPVHYNASTLIDHRKPSIPQPVREITLEPAPTAKRVDMEKLLALPADEFRRVVNGTPGLREMLDGERS